MQHDRRRPLARTGGGGLELLDTPDSLQIRAELPHTREADDALELVRRRVLRGWSVEFEALEESQEADLRTVEVADLSGLGLVDRPAYRGAQVEMRQDGEGLEGRFFYDADMIISDSDRVRKERIRPGAFTFALEAPDREINLMLGSPERPLASKRAGTLKLRDTPNFLHFLVPRLPRTSYVNDMLALLAGRSVIFGLLPFFLLPPPSIIPNASAEEPEPGNPGVFRRMILSAVLTGLAVQYRAARGNPGEVLARAEEMETPVGQHWAYSEEGLAVPAPELAPVHRRKRLWL